MVERFHRQLKVALVAQLDTSKWSKDLPIVLLGLRSIVKENIKSTAAEMVYGKSLINQQNSSSSTMFLVWNNTWRNFLFNLYVYILVPHLDSSESFFFFFSTWHEFKKINQVTEDLTKCCKIFFFTIDKNNNRNIMPVDRFKPAYIETSKNLLNVTKMNQYEI